MDSVKNRLQLDDNYIVNSVGKSRNLALFWKTVLEL